MLAPRPLTVSFPAPSGLLRGRPGPRESRIETALAPLLPGSDEVRNTYGWSSTTEPGGNFHTSVRVIWDAQYRVNGGAWQQLTTLSQQYEALLPVRQSQPIVTNP